MLRELPGGDESQPALTLATDGRGKAVYEQYAAPAPGAGRAGGRRINTAARSPAAASRLVVGLVGRARLLLLWQRPSVAVAVP